VSERHTDSEGHLKIRIVPKFLTARFQGTYLVLCAYSWFWQNIFF